MEHFDLYYAWPEDSSPIKSAVIGMKCWLDGCDGFYDEYFSGCGDHIRFAVLIPDQSRTLIPGDQAAFEAIPFIEAKVITPETSCGEIEVTKKQTLGAWMRSVDLSNSHSLADLPFNEQQERELCATLLKKVPAENWVLWKAAPRRNVRPWIEAPQTGPPVLVSHLTAICIFKTEKETRCLILRDNAIPSMIFQINE